jgi:hypothetical protein
MEPDPMGFYRIYPTRPTLFLPDDSNLVNLTDVPILVGHFDLATWHAAKLCVHTDDTILRTQACMTFAIG